MRLNQEKAFHDASASTPMRRLFPVALLVELRNVSGSKVLTISSRRRWRYPISVTDQLSFANRALTSQPRDRSGLKSGFPTKLPGKNPKKIEEAWLRDPFGKGDTKCQRFKRLYVDGGAEAGCVPKAIKGIASHGHVHSNAVCVFSAPFAGQRLMLADAVLSGETAKSPIVGLERFAFIACSKRKTVIDRAGLKNGG